MDIDYTKLTQTSRNKKFQLLKQKNTIECNFHPSEPCTPCKYYLKCELKSGA